MYDAKKIGVKGIDLKITLKNANTRRYQELVNEFNSVMEDVVNEVLGDADPNDRVRFAILSSNFDRALNTTYQPRSEVTGVALAELFGKMLQSNQSIDIDNDLTLHVQRVKLPRGNGCNRKLTVNMGLNLLLKRCVFTAARQYDDIPCFGYALALAIMLKDHNAHYVERRFSIYKQKVLDRVHDIFNIANIPYGPVDFAQYPQFVPLLPQNCRLIVVDAKERGTSLLYKSKVVSPVDNVPVYDVCLLLHGEHYYSLNSLSAWFGRSYYCMECEKAFNDKNQHKCKSEYTCSMCKEKACLYKPSYTRFCKECFGVFRNSICFKNHKQNEVCARATSCEKCGHWFAGPISNHICESFYCTYCKKEVIRNHECFVEVEKKIENKPWRYVFYDFECTQNTLDAETDRPVHKVNYCVAMSVCDKCTDDHPCEDCSQTQTFSGLKGRDALKDFCMWAFDDKINMEAVFIAHNGSNYDSHFILSYLVENTEYPEILANGGKILQMYIKTCESKFIDSCCFLSMPLSKFSDTFNLPDVVKGTFPHCFNIPNNYGYVGLLPALHYYEPDSLKEPARSKLIKWHGEHSNDEFIFDREIHEYCMADVALLKSGCMKFRASFLADTGIDPFCSCTIAGACMHVFRTSHLKEKTIARVPPNGYRSMRNYSNKSMGWITYCEKITGVRYKHAWSGGEMYLKDAKLWADAYYESGHHKWVGAFLGCMYHGCPACYDKQTFNTMLNKTMGDLYRETERWIERVKTCGYMYSIMWECQWDKFAKQT